MIQTLSHGEVNLLNYRHHMRGATPGRFRETLDMGYKEERWTAQDVLDLEKGGLVSLSQSMLLVGIFIPSLTERGIDYIWSN